ncbi:MAG: RNA-binding protein [Candidatus Woesearchaeota archaeon]|nr:MAG: RNA-binding protein [Candidatus Woesearchaeota archaeon]
MSKLLVNERAIVVPGELIAEGMDFLPSTGTYRANDHIIANRLGLLQVSGKVVKTVPLSGVYQPKKNDVVIGKVIDVLISGWRVDIGGAYSAVIGLKDGTFDFVARGADLTKYFCIDDYAAVKITNVTSQNLIDISAKGQGLGKLTGGRLITVNSAKVPRVIGKSGSMVSLLKRATGCRIVVGQNGLIWINGTPEEEYVVVGAIRMIEKYAHISGLTNRVETYLKEKLGEEALNRPEVPEEQVGESERPPMRERRPDRDRPRSRFEGRDRRERRPPRDRPPMQASEEKTPQGSEE